jgi:uroporphyrinogen decarboxylase
MSKKTRLNPRENYIATATMGKSIYGNPESIPVLIGLIPSMWAIYKKDLESVVLRHPTLFNYREGSVDYQNMQFSTQELDVNTVVDAWGCTWRYPLRYMDGVAIGHPLEDFDALERYTPPVSPFAKEWSPEEWQEELRAVKEQKEAGTLVTGMTDHGIMLLRHTYLRGFENAMFDYMDEDPRLQRLLDMIVDYYTPLVQYHVRRKVDVMNFAEDLGTQNASLISPAMFEKWIAPAYNRLMQPCRDAGILTHLHSDGYVMELVDILHKFGVDIINVQDLCNGIDALAKHFKGKICIDLDIDRQTVIPFGTPGDIHDLIREETMKLGSPQGGLMLVCGVYPPTPMENLEALCSALEKYRTYWW